MLNKLSSFIALCCVLLLTGCLDYGQQTLTYRYDAKTDTLRVFQLYQGIFGEDKQDGLSEKELEQLQSVLSGQRTFFFANWIWEYDRSEVSKALVNLDKPDAALDSSTCTRREGFLKLLMGNTRVDNGAFYMDEQGRLCAMQSVTVSRFSNLVAAGNLQIRDLLKLESNREDASPEEHALYLKSAKKPKPYIRVEGNQLRFHLPITRAAFEKSYGPNSSSAKQLEEFKRQGGQLAFANNEMKWGLGAPSDQATTLTLPVSEKPYIANALDAVKSRVAVLEKMDVAAAAKAFIGGTSQNRKSRKP